MEMHAFCLQMFLQRDCPSPVSVELKNGPERCVPTSTCIDGVTVDFTLIGYFKEK